MSEVYLSGFSTEWGELGDTELSGFSVECGELGDVELSGFSIECGELGDTEFSGFSLEADDLAINPILTLSVKDKKANPMHNCLVKITSDDDFEQSGLTDVNGIIKLEIYSGRWNNLSIEKTGKQFYKHKFFADNHKNWEISLNSIVPIVLSGRGYSVNLSPTDPENFIFV